MFYNVAGIAYQRKLSGMMGGTLINFAKSSKVTRPPNGPLFPNLPDVGKPLPDSVVLTPTEIAAIEARGAEYNGAIIAAANQRDIPVADVVGFFARVSRGIDIGGGSG